MGVADGQRLGPGICEQEIRRCVHALARLCAAGVALAGTRAGGGNIFSCRCSKFLCGPVNDIMQVYTEFVFLEFQIVAETYGMPASLPCPGKRRLSR